jgi:ABC-type lipoprotein export system ATPase subunit
MDHESAPLIQISGLHKDFKMGHLTVRALDGVDLDIQPGTFTVVMGPSGSGKHPAIPARRPRPPHSRRINVHGQAVEAMDETSWPNTGGAP